MRALPVEPVAGAPAFVAGVAVVRGRAVPVLDLGRLMTGEASVYRRFISLRIGADQVVLAVAELGGTRRIDLERFGRLPPVLGDASAHVTTLAALDGALLHVLTSARLIELGAMSSTRRSEA